MARKVILKTNGINGLQPTATGYQFLGLSGSTLSQKEGTTITGVGGGSGG